MHQLKVLALHIKNLTMDWKTIKAFGMGIINLIKKQLCLATFWGTRYFRGGGGGVATFGDSLFSGFIRSHIYVLMFLSGRSLLSGGCYFRRVITIQIFTVLIM